MHAQELSPRELVETARYLSEIAGWGGAGTAARLLALLSISTSRVNPNQQPLDLWFEIVRLVHAGASKNAGYGRQAMAVLLEAAGQEFPGNQQLADYAHHLASSAPMDKHPGRADVFLSHATADNAAMETLHTALLAAKPTLDVFLDYKSLLPGQQWLDTLRQNLSQTSLLVAWMTPSFLKSPFCNYEIGLAESAGARVIPVAVPPLDQAEMPAYLSSLQHLQFDGDFARLADAIIHHLPKEPA